MISNFLKIFGYGPRYLIFTVTSRCNAFCDFCWNWENVLDAGRFAQANDKIARNELSLEEISTLADSFPALLSVNLCGGEPFLRNDLVDIVSIFHNKTKTKHLSISTNGFLTERIIEYTTKILINNPKLNLRLFISIDGPKKEHEQSRKVKGGFDMLLNTARLLHDMSKSHDNLLLACNINFNSNTQHYISDFLDEVIDLHYFTDINIDLIRGNPFKKDLLNVDLSLFIKLKNKLKTHQENSKDTPSSLYLALGDLGSEITIKCAQSEKREFSCHGGSKMIVMDDLGNIWPCELLMNKVMGNVRDFNYNIKKLLHSSQAKEITKFVNEKKCHCTWECAINAGIVFNPFYYPIVLYKTILKMLK